jgi:hypothetical protein
MNTRALAVTALILPFLAAAQDGPPAPPQEPPRPRWHTSGSIGAGSSYGGTYLLVGARVAYEVALGLALGLDGQLWTGHSPSVGKVAPGLIWYSPVGLYAGAYYARWLVGGGRPDQDAVGLRGGMSVLTAGPVSATVGLAWERALSCRVACESWWPEAGVGVRF